MVLERRERCMLGDEYTRMDGSKRGRGRRGGEGGRGICGSAAAAAGENIQSIEEDGRLAEYL